MRADADFMVFVGARWPSLLREAVLLGCPPERAPEAVVDALSRCRRSWGRAGKEEGVDQLVRGELAAACARRPSSASTEQERREQGEELVVLSPPSLEDLRAEERARQARTAKLAVGVLLPLLLVAAGLTWWTTRDRDDPRPEPELEAAALLTREENPAGGVTWWANGELHLDHVVLAVEGLRDMTRLGSGAVYGDDQGRVVYVANDGSRTVLGHKDPEVPVAATEETGLAAWFDPDTEEIVALDASSGTAVLRTGVDDRPRVVAVDGDVIYIEGEDGARALLPTGPTSEVLVSPGGLLDVRSRIRAFQLDISTIQVVQSYFNVSFALPGRGARLSPDGVVVATRLPDTDGRVAVYDTRSGALLPNGLRDDDSALAFAPGDGLSIAYVVAPYGLTSDSELQLRTCDLRTSFCRIVVRIPDDGSTPVLAR